MVVCIKLSEEGSKELFTITRRTTMLKLISTLEKPTWDSLKTEHHEWKH